MSAILADLPGGNRIVKRIEEYLGEEFSHYEPAFHLLRNQVELLEKIDGESLNRFEALFVRINNALS